MKKIFYTLSLVGLTFGVNAQFISITNQAVSLSEDFNTLATSGTLQTTLPNGWWVAELPGDFGYRADAGTTNSGDTYSYGTGTDAERALGGVGSGSVSPNFGVRYINNSGSAFTSFNFDLTLEQWRSGGLRTVLDSLYFFYAVNGNNDSLGKVKILNGTWTRHSNADMISKIASSASATALNGNLAANQQGYSFNVTGLTVNIGDTLYLRWRDPNTAGSDDGLAIDNFRFSVLATVPVKWKSFTATKGTAANLLKWSTASETNNRGFEVERSVNGKTFESIGMVKGTGNSNKVLSYSFNDTKVRTLSGAEVYYRLKQVDFDGKSEYSKTISIINAEQKTGLGASLPNPFNNELNVIVNSVGSLTATVMVMDMIGKVHHTSTEQMVVGVNKVTIETTDMPDGIYFVRVSMNGETFTQKVIKK